MWWKFTEDGEHVLYQLDEQTGHIAPIDTVDVVGAATPESVAKGGIFAQFAGSRLDQIAVNSSGVVYFSAPKRIRTSSWPVVAQGVEGAAVYTQAGGLTVNTRRFDLRSTSSIPAVQTVRPFSSFFFLVFLVFLVFFVFFIFFV